MVIDLKGLVEYVDSKITESNPDKCTIIVPIISHVKNDDRVVISKDKYFKTSLEEDRLVFVCEYNECTYTIHDDFNDFKGNKSSQKDIHDYMSTLKHDIYDNHGPWVTIYYRFTY